MKRSEMNVRLTDLLCAFGWQLCVLFAGCSCLAMSGLASISGPIPAAGAVHHIHARQRLSRQCRSDTGGPLRPRRLPAGRWGMTDLEMQLQRLEAQPPSTRRAGRRCSRDDGLDR